MSQHAFIIGAQRAGTSFLCHLLDESKEICVAKPLRPEPKYFLNNDASSIDLQYYVRSFFKEYTNEKVLLEKSTSYYEFESVAKLLFAHCPKAKILFCLRNPVKRAISNYQFSVDNGIEKLPFSEAVSLELEGTRSYDKNQFSTSPFRYLARGLYINHLIMYLRYFPREQIHVCTQESLVSDVQTIKNICKFLGIEEYEPESFNTPVNQSTSRYIINETLLSQLKTYFKPYNDQLSEFTKLDLSCWE